MGAFGFISIVIQMQRHLYAKVLCVGILAYNISLVGINNSVSDGATNKSVPNI